MIPNATTNQHFDAANRRAAHFLGANPEALRFGYLLRSRYVGRDVAHPRTVKHFRGFLDAPTRIVDDEGQLRKEAAVRSLFLSNDYYNRLERWHRPQNNCFDVITGLLMHRHNLPEGAEAASHPAYEELVGQLAKSGAWKQELQALTEALLLNESRPRTAANNGFPQRLHSIHGSRMLDLINQMLAEEERRNGADDKRESHTRRDFDPALTVTRFQPVPRTSRPTERGPPPPSRSGSARTRLGQVLQTDEPDIIRSWLLAADERQKSLVFQILHSAMPAVRRYATQLSTGNLAKQAEPTMLNCHVHKSEERERERAYDGVSVKIPCESPNQDVNAIMLRECGVQTDSADVTASPARNVAYTPKERSTAESCTLTDSEMRRVKTARDKQNEIEANSDQHKHEFRENRARTATARLQRSATGFSRSDVEIHQGSVDILKVFDEPRPRPRPRTAARPSTAQNINMKLFALGQPNVQNLELNVEKQSRPSTSYRMRYVKTAESRSSISRQLEDVALSQ